MTDPRYDPRFQRGWGGEVPPPAAVPAPPPSAPVAPPASPPSEREREPGFEPQREPERRPIAPPVEGVADAAATSDPTDDEPPAPGRNPYRVALVIGGIVLLALAGGLIWKAAQPTSGGPQSTADYVWMQLEQELTPFLLLAGVIALVVAIALGALVRRR